MSYRIEYGKDKKRRISRFPKGTGFLIAICCLVLLAALEFTGLRDRLWHYLMPGDSQVTAAALDGLVADLKDGSSAGEAITAFCREIVKNADLPK